MGRATTETAAWSVEIARALGAVGLDVVGVADGAGYQEVLPGCRSVLVLGSGRALWDAFVAAVRGDPDRLTGELHPLDAFVRRALAEVDPGPPASRRWIRCAADEPDPVDFRTLALDAGLGWRSALGLLLHPVRGVWFALRAACFTTSWLPPSNAPAGDGPCLGCHAPCASACPAGAIQLPFTPAGAGGWQADVCARWNIGPDPCASSCAARVACPAGAEHAYSPLQRHYHQDRRSGRRALAALLGIADTRSGIGPHWAAWAGERP
jgi:epoxyqueuosine reductase